MWAEQFGLGEIGLSPDVFWSLTAREFWIKHAAFARSEDRMRSWFIELAVLTGQFKEKDRNALRRQINALRRYPIKQWLR